MRTDFTVADVLARIASDPAFAQEFVNALRELGALLKARRGETTDAPKRPAEQQAGE